MKPVKTTRREELTRRQVLIQIEIAANQIIIHAAAEMQSLSIDLEEKTEIFQHS